MMRAKVDQISDLQRKLIHSNSANMTLTDASKKLDVDVITKEDLLKAKEDLLKAKDRELKAKDDQLKAMEQELNKARSAAIQYESQLIEHQ